ncbi:hypothetical protein [Streptosporangium sp. NPDC048865]|uniref:hypothetical protein n=1 Tax=Streptosporangium sp. NPDC048865 TaxID=3155766 RepID=UPI003421CE13
MVWLVAMLLAMSEGDPENMQRAQVFALGAIALMVAGAACGAAERRTAHPPQAPPQPYPQQGHNPQQAYAAQQGYPAPQGHTLQQGYTLPQAYNPQQGYPASYPPGQNH